MSNTALITLSVERPCLVNTYFFFNPCPQFIMQPCRWPPAQMSSHINGLQASSTFDIGLQPNLWHGFTFTAPADIRPTSPVP